MLGDLMIFSGCGLLLAGAGFGCIAALGVLRLPDLASRAHAASKAGAVGGGFVLLAVALACFDAAVAVRAIVGIGFLLLTTPLAAHLLIRAGYRSDDGMNSHLVLDERKTKS